MPFHAKPLLPGDLYDSAEKFSTAALRDLHVAMDDAVRKGTIVRLWDQAMSLGWASTTIPENAGGAGCSLIELAGIVEAAGRAALPLPLIGACAVVPTMLGSALPNECAVGLLQDVVSGQVHLTPVFGAACSWEEWGSGPALVRAATEPGGYRLTGQALGLEFVPGTTHFLVACGISGAAGAGLFVVPAASAGLVVQERRRLDDRLSVDVCFDVAVAKDRIIASGSAVRESAERAQAEAAVLVCLEGVAVLGALIEQTVEYLFNRVQFGVKLSSFQVLRHRVADLFVAYQNCRALIDYTLHAVAEAQTLPWREISLSKIRIGEVCRVAAESAIQLHGGMGMTEELLATRLSKRLLMADLEYGDRMFHANRVFGQPPCTESGRSGGLVVAPS